MSKKIIKAQKDLREFKTSLKEGVKFSRGQKTKLKVETLYVRLDPEIERLWAEEAERRFQDHKQKKTKLIDGTKVLERLKAQHP